MIGISQLVNGKNSEDKINKKIISPTALNILQFSHSRIFTFSNFHIFTF